MRLLAALRSLCALAAPVAADDPRAARDGVRPEVTVPVAPYEHERLYYFGADHVVPGTVTINRAP